MKYGVKYRNGEKVDNNLNVKKIREMGKKSTY